MSIPPKLTRKNSAPSLARCPRRSRANVQWRLPIQLATMASDVEMTLAITGPSWMASGESTVTRSRLNTLTSMNSPMSPTSPNRVDWVSSLRNTAPG